MMTFTNYFFLILSILSIIIFRIINYKEDPAILGVYRNPGRWYYIKFLCFYILLNFKKFISKIRSKKSDNGAGYGSKSRNSIEDMDCAQPLSDDCKAIDAVYFNSASKDGCYLVGGAARRPNGIINGFLYIKVPAVGLLLTPKLPDTTLIQTKEEQEYGVFGAEGLKFEPIYPMKQWRISYEGKMKSFQDQNKLYDVKFVGIWDTNLDYFDFDTDMHPVPISKAIATQPWSKEYFNTLQEAHQTHYEQHGDINGNIDIDGKIYPIHLNSMRDHSYGRKREWRQFHRYALHMVTLEDNTRFCVGIISNPLCFSSLELGYLYTPNGELHSVSSCDLKLYQCGEDETPPIDYSFQFKAGNQVYDVHVDVEHSPEFYIGDDWEARVVERMAKFTVNGKRGWGMAEWEYRNLNGKPKPKRQVYESDDDDIEVVEDENENDEDESNEEDDDKSGDDDEKNEDHEPFLYAKFTENQLLY